MGPAPPALGGARNLGSVAVPLSVVVPSRKAWPHPRNAIEAVRRQVLDVGGEVVLAIGHPDGAPPEELEGVRVVTVDDNDVFTARAEAVIAAAGEVVAVLEDHCYAPAGWADALLASWAAHPDAGALVNSIANGAPRLLDEASFLLTWAPFLGPMPTVPTDRSPAPGVLSYRASVLPDEVPPSGWLEYELPAQLRAEGRMVADASIRMVHTQHVGVRGFLLQYWAGRGYGGLRTHAAAQRPLRMRLAYAAAMPWRLYRQTSRAVAAADPVARPRGTMAVLALMCTCNGIGQVVGVLTGRTGRSLRELE